MSKPKNNTLARAPFSGTGLGCPVAGSKDLPLAWIHYLRQTYETFKSAKKFLPAPMHKAQAAAVAAAQSAMEKDPAKTFACLTSPAVGTGLHCRVFRDNFPAFTQQIEERVRQVTPNLLLEFAESGLLRGKAEWPHPAPAIGSPRLGFCLAAPQGASGWRFTNGRVEALKDGRGAGEIDLKNLETPSPVRVDRLFFDLNGIARFSTYDPNPVAAFEEHPDKPGSVATLGGKPVADWTVSLERSIGLVEKYCPEWAQEMRTLLQVIVPVGYYDEKHLSASYREAIGVIYMTLHENDLVMLTALIHEFQHNKIHAAAYGDPFLHNAHYPLFKSPVRPDPRPLWGILLAVHAFLPVAVVLRRLREADEPAIQKETLEWMMGDYDLKNHEGMEMLRKNAEWTKTGRELFDVLDELDRTHMREREKLGLPTKPTHVHHD